MLRGVFSHAPAARFSFLSFSSIVPLLGADKPNAGAQNKTFIDWIKGDQGPTDESITKRWNDLSNLLQKKPQDISQTEYDKQLRDATKQVESSCLIAMLPLQDRKGSAEFAILSFINTTVNKIDLVKTFHEINAFKQVNNALDAIADLESKRARQVVDAGKLDFSMTLVSSDEDEKPLKTSLETLKQSEQVAQITLKTRAVDPAQIPQLFIQRTNETSPEVRTLALRHYLSTQNNLLIKTQQERNALAVAFEQEKKKIADEQEKAITLVKDEAKNAALAAEKMKQEILVLTTKVQSLEKLQNQASVQKSAQEANTPKPETKTVVQRPGFFKRFFALPGRFFAFIMLKVGLSKK